MRESICFSLDAMYSAIPILINLGLVRQRKQSERFPFQVEIELAEKGQRLAKHLAEIEKILME